MQHTMQLRWIQASCWAYEIQLGASKIEHQVLNLDCSWENWANAVSSFVFYFRVWRSTWTVSGVLLYDGLGCFGCFCSVLFLQRIHRLILVFSLSEYNCLLLLQRKLSQPCLSLWHTFSWRVHVIICTLKRIYINITNAKTH